MDNNHLISTFMFPNVDPLLLNNTLIECVDEDARLNNETFYMAGNYVQ